jgi:putative phage-type endonuclease
MSKLINAEQGSQEWLEARLGKATASRFSDIVAKTRTGYSASRKNYMAELVTQRLTGTIPDNFSSSAMQWGTDNEPLARLAYSLESGNEVEETGFWQHDSLMTGASPDGFVNEDGTLEIKCPNTATHIETLQTKKIPTQYYAQVQGQMWITNKFWCDFVSYDPRLPDNAQMIIIRVERDDSYVKELAEEVEKFLLEVDEQVNFEKNYKE